MQNTHTFLEIKNFLLEEKYDEVKTILKIGDVKNIKDENGNTILHLLACIEKEFPSKLKHNHVKAILKLALKYMDYTIKNNQGDAPIMSAARCGNAKIVKTLFLSDPDFGEKIRDKYGDSLLFALINDVVDDKECAEAITVSFFDRKQFSYLYDNSLLHHAAMYGLINTTQELLNHHSIYWLENFYGDKPADIAANKGHSRIAKMLGFDYLSEEGEPFIFEKGDIDPREKINENLKSYNTFKRLLDDADNEGLKQYLENCTDADPTNLNDETPLFYTIANNQFDVAKKLLLLGANSEHKNIHNFTPLLCALKTNNIEAVKFLITEGASIEEKGESNVTPLFYAAKCSNFEIIKLLIDYGADINVFLGQGETLLHNTFSQLSPHEIINLIDILIEKGIDVNTQDFHGRTVFSYQIYYSDVARYLISKGATIHGTTLFQAAYCRDLSADILSNLLNQGLDINQKNEDGKTPLFFAETEQTIKAFIEHGANINALDDDGNNLLYRFRLNNDVLTYLIAQGINANIKDNSGGTPLHYPHVYHFTLENIQLLIDSGLDINAQDNEGNTILHKYVHQDIDTIELLLKNKANPYIKNNSGYTAVEWAEHQAGYIFYKYITWYLKNTPNT